ncbi:MAG: AMP-binding protein [Deltaproteobacteria bacterium]|nr:AMP-binding protein [Deltaproteobacteria bacterium]
MATLLTNPEILTGGARFANALDSAGLGRRASVAVLLHNTSEFLWAYRGSVWSGRRFTPLSWRWSPEEVRYVVEDCEADAFVVDARCAEAALAAASLVPESARFCVGGEIPGFRPWQEVEAEPCEPLAPPLAGECMLYTSGTTGRPKGVQRGQLPEGPPPSLFGRAGMAMLQAFLPEGDRDSAHLVATPLYHAGPCTYADGAALLGADLVLMEHFDAEEFLKLVEQYRVTSTFMVPTQFVRLLHLPAAVRERYDTSSLRLVCHGAAPVALETKRQMIDWLGPVLFEFYGGTEGGGCMISSQEWLAHPGSVGRPRPGVEVHILGDDGEPLPAGREGGVFFNLEASPFDYKGDPDKTQEGRIGNLFTMGDIGRVDDEGYLYLCDRSADVILSGGVNIYPAQIESVLLELPFVADCCVVGVPDDEWGEAVRALVQLEPGASAAGDPEARIIEHCRARLSGHQVPRVVELRDSLPRTETGKLLRRQARDPFWEGRDRRI